jgi:hypothetical protein
MSGTRSAYGTDSLAAKDGQMVFLHPFNVKCLLHEFGASYRFPDSLSGQIIDTEEMAMTEVSSLSFVAFVF